MNVSPHTQAILLLTGFLGKGDSGREAPLSNREWSRLAVWMRSQDLEPGLLLTGDPGAVLSGWTDRKVSAARIRSLLDRGAMLALALERWSRVGLWILTRSDPEYPQRLNRRLRADAPAVLFGSGNRALMNAGGIAVAGSRDAGDQDLSFTRRVGRAAAADGRLIISGGARGVDQAAMLAALECGGTAVGVVAGNLVRLASSLVYRNRIISGELALLSAYHPEAGFSVGRAMGRNRYIYCMSDAAVVVCSSSGRGGTWYGAVENLKAGWVPLWVKHDENKVSGNRALLKRGAVRLPDNVLLISDLVGDSVATSSCGSEKLSEPLSSGGDEIEANEQDSSRTGDPTFPAEPFGGEPAQGSLPVVSRQTASKDFYCLFLEEMDRLAAHTPRAPAEIALHLKLEQSQVKAWLRRGVADGKFRKLTRPVRYQVATHGLQQLPLFREEGPPSD